MNETEAFLSKCHKVLTLGKFKFIIRRLLETCLFILLFEIINTFIDLLRHYKQLSYFSSSDFLVDMIILGIVSTIIGLIDGFCEWNYYVCRYERMTGKKIK